MAFRRPENQIIWHDTTVDFKSGLQSYGGHLGLPSFGGGEDERELEQRPRPDGEHQEAEDLVRVDLLGLDGVEELDDVCGRSDVDEEQLGELIAGQVALGQHPATNDEYEHQELLDYHHNGVVVHWNRETLEVQWDLRDIVLYKL